MLIEPRLFVEELLAHWPPNRFRGGEVWSVELWRALLERIGSAGCLYVLQAGIHRNATPRSAIIGENAVLRHADILAEGREGERRGMRRYRELTLRIHCQAPPLTTGQKAEAPLVLTPICNLRSGAQGGLEHFRASSKSENW